MTLPYNRSRSLQGHNFEQTMIDRSHQCYIPSFIEIGPTVLEKRILKGFYHIWTWQPFWSCDPYHVIKFSFPCTLKLSYKIWFRTAKYFLRKSGFNFCMYTTLDQGQEMKVTFDTHIPSLIQLNVCSYQKKVIEINGQELEQSKGKSRF